MPELPDVEIYRRYMETHCLDQKINRVKVLADRILEGVAKNKINSDLAGRKFVSTNRYGKYMFAKLDSGGYTFFHFGMTGYLDCWHGEKQMPEYTRALFDLGQGHLAFVLQRKLGKLGLVSDVDNFTKDHHLGPDALQIDKSSFMESIKKSNAYVKSFLMDQKHLAGIGNIYSNEILFQARIFPKTKSGRLSSNQINTLYEKMRCVLYTAIEDRADTQRMPGSFLISHRQMSAKCPCGGHVESLKVSGRTSYYCPKCQKQL